MTPLEKIRSALVVGGIFGLTLQEGRGQVQFAELLLPGKRLLVCLYSIQETHEDSGYHACSERKEKVRTRFESAGRSSGQVRAYGHPRMTWTAGLWHLRRLFSSAEKIFPGLRA